MKITLNDIIKALYSDKDKNDKIKTKTDTTMYGEVMSINNDGTYNVKIGDGTVTCDRLVGANVGDSVMVMVQRTGHPTVINTVGGDADALKALEQAGEENQHFWFKEGSSSEAGAHITEEEQDDFETNPMGGNILLRSNTIKMRMALTTLVELMSDTTNNIHGLKIYEPSDSTNPITQFLNTGALIGKETETHWHFHPMSLRLYRANASEPDAYLMPVASNNVLGLAMETKHKDSYDRYTNFTSMKQLSKSAGAEMEFSEQSTTNGSPQYVRGITVRMSDSDMSIEGYNTENDVDPMLTLKIPIDIDWDQGNARLTFDGHPPFKKYTVSGSKSISANISDVVECTGTIPTGYTPIAVSRINVNDNTLDDRVAVVEWNLYTDSTKADYGKCSIRLRNLTGSALSNVPMTADILCTSMQPWTILQ